jgi:hypothetical protein
MPTYSKYSDFNTGLTNLVFPNQKISYSEKNDEWYIKNCLYFESLLLNGKTGIPNITNKTLINKQTYYNGYIDNSEYRRIVNPHGLEGVRLPNDFKHYPISNPRVNTLVGEELKRKFEWVVYVTNRDAITDKERAKKAYIDQFVVQEIQNTSSSEEELQKRLEDFQRDLKNWQDTREIGSMELLKYLFNYLNIKFKFNRGFEEQIITGKEVFNIDVFNNKPIFETVPAETIYFLKSPQDPFYENSDASCQLIYEPIGKVIDKYYEYLTPEDIDKLNTRYGGYPPYKWYGPSAMWTKGVDENTGAAVAMPMLNGEDLPENINQPNLFKGFYDQRGNVRVIHVRWKGQRKVGKLTFYDENGNLQTDWVSEEYKLNKLTGETIEWKWITEVYESTRIADDIFVKLEPRKLQYRKLDNISECSLGYAGCEIDLCLYDLMRNYNLRYNAVQYKLNDAFAKYIGRVANLDLSSIPDEWSPDQIVYFAAKMGWKVSDSFKEGKKGQAMGKLAGNMSSQAGDIQIGDATFLQICRKELIEIESDMDSICGIPPQRRGEKTPDGLGVTQMQMQASSNITEPYFFIHEEVKLRALRMLLEAAKSCVKNGAEWIQYVTDDAYIKSVRLDPEVIYEADYNVQVGYGIHDARMLESLRQAIGQSVQTGMVSPTILMDIASNDSTASIKRKVEEAERAKLERDQQASQRQMEHEKELQSQQLQLKQMEYELQKYKIDTESKTRIYVAELQALGYANAEASLIDESGDLALKQLAEQNKSLKINLDHQAKMKQEETKTNLKSKELALKSKELNDKMKLEREKLDVELANQENDIQVALINARNRNNGN